MPVLSQREFLVSDATVEPRLPKGGATIGRHLSRRTALIVCGAITAATIAFLGWLSLSADDSYPTGAVSLGGVLVGVLLCMFVLDDAFRTTRIEGSAIVIRSFSGKVSVDAGTIRSFEVTTYEDLSTNSSQDYSCYTNIVQKDGTSVPLGRTSRSPWTDQAAEEDADEVLNLIAAYLGLQFEHVWRKAPKR